MTLQTSLRGASKVRSRTFLQVVVEAVEALLPVPPVSTDPVGDIPERFRIQPAWPPLGLPSLLDEAGALEHLQVLRDRGQAHIEGSGELRNGRLAVGEAGEDRPSLRIGEGRERGAEMIGCWLHFASWLINLPA
jgi:hypothetical protein